MLNVKNITVEYDERPVVEDFSLEMGEGEIVSLVGESGSGKTTVIRAILACCPRGARSPGGRSSLTASPCWTARKRI